MKDFDPFNAQKESTFVSSLPQITAVAKYLNGALSKPNVQDQDIKDLRTEFEHLLLVIHHLSPSPPSLSPPLFTKCT